MKVLKEWFITAPWGKVALISWGTPDGPPVLLVHGRQDSAATFVPLLELLPSSYYYVGVDIPGNGRSDPLPQGAMLCRLHFVATVELVVRHLKWNDFVYFGHSMGTEQGLFYNAVYPHRVSKFVFLDPGPSWQRLQIHDPVEHFRSFYEDYYDHFSTFSGNRVYSKQKAVEAVSRARGFTAAQAEVVLSRNLKQVGDDLYELSWDKRLRLPAPPNYPTDFYYQVWSKNAPPTFIVSASTSDGYKNGKAATEKLIADLKRTVDNFHVLNVEGGHDVHFTNPERFIKQLCEFLDKRFVKAKL